jgi:SOS-response transcriptional repressor LexA
MMAKTTTTVTVVGEVAQGAPLRSSKETVMLPAAILEAQEEVYRVADSSLAASDLFAGDLLIVVPRRKAETGELVLARLDAQLFVGRWWAKHGRRDLLDADGQTVIVRGATVIGSINLIVRPQ